MYYLFILLGYLSGSILYAQLIPRLLNGIDIREAGIDHNPEALTPSNWRQKNRCYRPHPGAGKRIPPHLCSCTYPGRPRPSLRHHPGRPGHRSCFPIHAPHKRRQSHSRLLRLPAGPPPQPIPVLPARLLLPPILPADHHPPPPPAHNHHLPLLQHHQPPPPPILHPTLRNAANILHRNPKTHPKREKSPISIRFPGRKNH